MARSQVRGIEKADVNTGPSPLVQRRRLRAELRRTRQEQGLTQEAVARAMDWSLSKVIRIETGAVGVSTNDLHALLRLYGISDSQRIEALVTLGREARQQAWWSRYRDLASPAYFQYIEYETAATVIRSHETALAPGLLQTKEYARAAADAHRPIISSRTLETSIEIHPERQDQMFGRPESPLAFFTIYEAAVRRFIGTADLARDQVTHLLEMAERPHVTIEVVPFSAGQHRGMWESFAILEFGDSTDQDVLYFEGLHDSMISHDEVDEIMVHRELFEELCTVSLSPGRTIISKDPRGASATSRMTSDRRGVLRPSHSGFRVSSI